ARRGLTDGELAFYACFGPAHTTLADLVRVAGARWAVEECFQAAKDQVGLDHYQVRRWDAWYRHVTLVLVAQGFLAAVRAQPGEGAAERAELPQPPGADRVGVSTAEAQRQLLVALVWWTPPTVRQVLWGSWWRRRHQARARRCHWGRPQHPVAAGRPGRAGLTGGHQRPDPGPGPIGLPAAQPTITGLPGPKPQGHIPPGPAGMQLPQDAAQDLAT